jgi:hypothetical protein
MVDVPVPGHQTLWTNTFSALKSEHQTLVQQYPEADAQLKQLLQVLGDIEEVARHIPASVGESAEWSAIVNAAEENGASYCPLRPADIDTDASGTEANSNEEAVPGKTGRPPPIILTSTTNLIQLQKQLKIVVKENF